MVTDKLNFLSKAVRSRTILLSILCLFISQSFDLVGQVKPAAGFKDFGRWENLRSAGSNGGLSPDGKWLTYAINRSNGTSELRIVKLAGGKTTTAAFATRPQFSSDSNWLAYAIGYSQEEREKRQKEKKPLHNKLGLMNLQTGTVSTVAGIESFFFSRDGLFLAMQRYRPKAAAPIPARRGVSEAEDRPGATIIVRKLADGIDTTFGNVSQLSWQDKKPSHLLAMTISADGKAGNGVHLFDPQTSILRVLDSSQSIYSGLTWRKNSTDLAVFRSKSDEGKDGAIQVLLAWTDIGKRERRFAYDPTTDTGFPAAKRTVTHRSFSWSADGKVLFCGIAGWEDKNIPPGTEAKKKPGKAKEEASTVEIWHWKDVYVMPWQKVHAAQDRRRNLLSAWHLADGRFVQLGRDPIHERVTPIRHSRLAYAAEWSRYAMERSIGRTGADLYLIDINSGERTKLLENINDRYLRSGPGGKYLLFLRDKHYWTINLTTRKITNITENASVSFINSESDVTSKIYPDQIQKPHFGVAGWTDADRFVLLYDKYDLWQVAADGTGSKRLTRGEAEQIRHRLIRLDAAGGSRFQRFSSTSSNEKAVDLSKPLYLSLYGEWTKKSGYARLKPDGKVSRLIWLDKNVASLARARESEVYRYVVQGYDDSPDIFVGKADLRQSKQVTETNAFQKEFAWGHSELIEYQTDKGRRLQGALFYPAGYEKGKTYPMIVYNYELLSQNVHRYVAPSDRSYYNISVFTSQGYLVLEPDIVFRPKQPGWSVVECIGAGVKKVVAMGVVDPERIGIIGHSMGGFNTAFVATHVNGVFAAAVAGAPITNLVSYYGDHHWGSGIAETDHIETGQERMEVALYEDLQAYIDNSAVYNVHNMDTPLLLEHGDSDGIIAWYQSIELYNIARRAKKNVVMLGYIGEDHGLRKKSNQRDYQQRILAWFGHYLKGEPAENWITEGKSFLERDTELKRLKTKK